MSQQQPFAAQARQNGHTPQVQRAPNDVRSRGLTGHNGHAQHMNGSASQPGVGVPVPRGPGAAGNAGAANGQGFAGARSPPNAKSKLASELPLAPCWTCIRIWADYVT